MTYLNNPSKQPIQIFQENDLSEFFKKMTYLSSSNKHFYQQGIDTIACIPAHNMNCQYIRSCSGLH